MIGIFLLTRFLFSSLMMMQTCQIKDLIIIRDQPGVNRRFHYFYVFINLEDQYAQNRNHTRRQVST
mgnify:CR=1 FL=1